MRVSTPKMNTLFAPLTLTPSEAEVIQLLRKSGPQARSELADVGGVSRAKMTSVVNRLMELQILEETGVGDSRGGRRPVKLDFNAGFGYVAGVDMGATSLDVVLADFKGQHLEHRSEMIDVRDGPDTVLTRVKALIGEMMDARSAPLDRLFSIGIGVPGPVEFSTGLLYAPPIMPGWEAYPIPQSVREAFPAAAVVVDNDVNVMALGELRAGAGVNEDNFIFVKIGTGIGSGIVCDGHIYRGTSGCAGDIGHICVDGSGRVCHCGNIGCLEAMAAAPAIAERALEAAESGNSAILYRLLATNGVLTAKDVSIAAAQGDRAANEIIQESGRMIGEVLASLVNFFNPSSIYIGGGVSNIGHQLLASIRRAVLHRSLPLSTRHLRIDYSAIGTNVGITGAVWLAMEQVFRVSE